MLFKKKQENEFAQSFISQMDEVLVGEKKKLQAIDGDEHGIGEK